MKKMTRLSYPFLLIMLLPSISAAAALSDEDMPSTAMEDEISYLLSAVDRDDCTFVRNDISYSSDEFQQHLRSKLEGNDELINSTEDFIEKVATRSSISESPYVGICEGELQIMKDWLIGLLESYRRGN
jgi:hypothetical protein